MAFDYQGFASLGVNLNRQKYGPLDISQVFNSQADLNYYISKGTITTGVSEYWYKSADEKVVPYPYSGQIVALVVDGNVSILYLSENDSGTFDTHEVGKAPVGDEATIDVSVEGIISILGFADAEAGSTLVKSADGKTVAWQKPSATTVEGLDSRLQTAETAIEDINGDITTIEGNITTINETLANTYNKTEVNELVAGAFHFKGEAAELKEDGNLYDEEGKVIAGKQGDVYQVGDVEYAHNGSKWVKLGFTLDLSGYATTAALTTAKEEAISTAASDATTKANQAKEDAIAAAATDATTKAEAAEKNAKEYANGILVTAKEYTDGKAENALADAKTYADGHLETAKGYTDTEVKKVSDSLTSLSNSLGELATKDKIAEADLAEALATKINNKADSTVVTDSINTAVKNLNNNIATAKAEAIEAANGNLATKVGDIGEINVKTYVDNQIIGVNSSISGVDTKVGTIQSTIAGYGDIVTHKASEFATTEALNAVDTKAGNAAAAAQEAKNAADAAQSKAEAVETYVGALPEGTSATTVIEYVNKKTEGIATDSSLAELQAIVDANSVSISTLLGKTAEDPDGDAGLSVRDIAAEETAKIVAGADEDYDTLKEIADFIKSDISGTAELISKVDANTKAIADETARATGIEEGLATRIKALEDAGAEENTIESIKVNGVNLTIGDDKSVEIPLALQASLGLVKGTDVENGVSINDDHTMMVNSINVNKLTQTAGDILTIDGGSASSN